MSGASQLPDSESALHTAKHPAYLLHSSMTAVLKQERSDTNRRRSEDHMQCLYESLTT